MLSMTALARTFTHNAWANGLVFEGLRRAPESFLDQPARDGNGTNREKLQHLVLVERGFLNMITGSGERPDAPLELDGLIAYSAESADSYVGLLGGEPIDLDREVHIPWWERNFTVGDCLTQVISHSSQHRAELAWELARVGIDTGEMDYIVWFAQRGEG
jgi:uncharacterized damage-inducible protein DinB